MTDTQLSPQTTEQGPDQRRRRLAAAALLLFVIVLVVLWILMHLAKVPYTIGMSETRAVRLLSEAGFDTSRTVVPTGSTASGRVVMQSPSQKWYLTFWPVYLTVGRQPSVASRDRVYLRFDSGASGIEVLPTGTQGNEVYPYDPEEMQPLYVPSATGEALMPDVQSMKKSDAVARLHAAGLTVSVESGPSTTDVAKGRVYYQAPAPGSGLDGVDSCVIWVSLGPLDNAYGKYRSFPYPRPPSGVE